MDTAALLSGQITFSGLGSGTDFASMVDKLVQLERRHILRLESWKKEWVDKKAAFQDLNTKLLNLRTSMQGMNTMSKFLVKTADSVNKAVLTATANDKAQVGTHVIEVGQLAQNHILASQVGFSGQKTDITGGEDRELVYSYKGGAPKTITIPKGMTLEGLVNLINTHPENPGVRAGIIKVAEEDFRLQLRGMDMGQGKEVVVHSSSIPGLLAGDFETTQNAQNARIKVDGFPLDDPNPDPGDPDAGKRWIERASNSVADLIEGVSVTLRDTGTTTLNIAVSNDAVMDNVRKFVNEVNEVRSKIKELTQVVGESSGSILTGNYGIQMIDSRLKSILAVKGTGFDVNNDVFSSLSMIGITTDADQGSPTFGLLKLDEEVLDHSLRNRPTELARIFAADYIGSSDSMNFRYYNSVDGLTKGGEYVIKYTVSGGRVTSATINGRPASISDVDEITGAYGNPEAGLAVKVDNLTDGTYSGKAFLKIGKARELADTLKDLTDTNSGPLNILKDNYKDITDNIDRKIEFEERRVSRMERDMRNRFARLESLLGYYDSLGKSINSQLTQLSADTKK